jgi:hypothetical protein
MWWARLRRSRTEKSQDSGEAENLSRPDDPTP